MQRAMHGGQTLIIAPVPLHLSCGPTCMPPPDEGCMQKESIAHKGSVASPPLVEEQNVYAMCRDGSLCSQEQLWSMSLMIM